MIFITYLTAFDLNEFVDASLLVEPKVELAVIINIFAQFFVVN